MNKIYSYKEYSDASLFENNEKRIQLKEYKDNLLFYNSCNTNLTADFGYGNKMPTVTGEAIEEIENLNNGTFGQYIKNSGTISYDKENFSLLSNEGCLKFRLGTCIENAFGRQRILLTNTFTIVDGTYSFFLKVGNEDPKEVNLALTSTMTRSDIVNTALVEVDPSFYKASVDVSDLENILIISDYVGDEISITSGTTGTDFLSLFQTETASMPNAPDTRTSFLSIENDTNNNGKIDFVHYNLNNKSFVDVLFYNNTGVLTTTLSTEFNNNINRLYAFELDFNSEIAYLFKDGELVDFKKTGFIRNNNDCLFKMSSGGVAYPYNFDEVILYSKHINCHSYSVETIPLTKYDTSNPYVDFYFGDGFIIENVEQCFVDSSNNISFIVFSGGKSYYYISGSWRSSDGTFSLSTDRATFETKITNFPFSTTEQVKVRAFFESDGTNESYINDLYFILDDIENGDKDALPATLLGDPHLDSPIDLTVTNLLTIETDQGTTTIDFSSLGTTATVQQIVDLINDSNATGIDRAGYNSFNQVFLVGKTRGKSGFITVSGAASIVIFGGEVTAVGVDQEEEKIDYSILFDYVKRRLGYPTVPVELTQEQMEDCLSDAINLYNKWRNYSQKVMYVNLTSSDGDGFDIPAIIGSERNIVDIIFKPRTPFGIYDTNNFEYNIYIQQLFSKYGNGGARSGFLTDYSISMNFIADSNLILGTEPRYDVFNRKIHIYPKPTSNFIVGIKYKGQLTIDEVMADDMVKLYMVGACRKIIGGIRGTFGGTINAGEQTLQMNGEAMIQQGQAEIDQAIKDLRGESCPLDFIVG